MHPDNRLIRICGFFLIVLSMFIFVGFLPYTQSIYKSIIESKLIIAAIKVIILSFVFDLNLVILTAGITLIDNDEDNLL